MRRFLPVLLLEALVADAVSAQTADASRLTLERLFASRDFAGEGAGVRWADATHTTAFEPSASGDGRDLVRTDVETGEKEVLVTAAQMTPDGADAPLRVQSVAWSDDERKVLLFTNSRRVWRINTRGDYWVLDLDGGVLLRLWAAPLRLDGPELSGVPEDALETLEVELGYRRG